MATKKIFILVFYYLIIILMKPQVKEINRFYVRNTSFGITLYEVGFKCQYFLAIAFYIFGMKPTVVENKLLFQIYIVLAFIVMCLLTKANNNVRGRIKQEIEEIEDKDRKNESIEELTKEVIVLSKIDSIHTVFEMFFTITMGHALFLLLSTWLYE